MANGDRALVGRILLAGAVVLGILALLSWTGRLGVDPRARRVLGTALGISALADGMIGLFLVMKAADRV